MNNTWKIVCSAIGGASMPLTENWRDVFEECKKQKVAGLVFPNVAQYLPANLWEEWKTYNLTMVSANVRLLHEQNQLGMLLKGYSFCILKGAAAAIDYPMPELRAMGDVDFIVPEDHFDAVKSILLKNSYALSEENNPRHIAFSKNGVLFEMHHYFRSGDSNIDQYIDRCWGRLCQGKIGNCVFPMLPTLENGLTLLYHICQHLHTGLGLRQILDWMMFVHANLTDKFWESAFEPEVINLGLYKLAIITTRMCQMYLGLTEEITWCRDADEVLCSRLMENIIQAGNFGKNFGPGKTVEKTIINFRKDGLFCYLQKAGEYNWKAYHNHSWLKPFAWAYQIGRYGRQILRTGRKGISLHDDISRSNERYELLRDLGL